MSARICTPTHIGYLAAWYCAHRTSDEFGELKAVASRLAKENVRSVECRYPDQATQDEPSLIGGTREDYYKECLQKAAEWKDILSQTKRSDQQSPMYALKQVQCLEYQSCECGDFEGGEAHELLRCIEHTALIEAGPAFIASLRDSPHGGKDYDHSNDYSRAPWGMGN